MSMIRIVPAAALALLALPIGADAAETFRAQGNEPFWSLRMTDKAITFQPMDGAVVTVAPVPEATPDGEADVIRATVDGESFALTIAGRVCTDTMTGMPYPVTVGVTFGAESYEGCGGDPAALLDGDWTVTAIDGQAPVADSEPTLSFGADARVSGNASCNRFFGGYTLTGEGLSFGEMGTSMMMCAEPVMAQERALLDVIEGTIGFSIADDGTLTLRTVGGPGLEARRADL